MLDAREALYQKVAEQCAYCRQNNEKPAVRIKQPGVRVQPYESSAVRQLGQELVVAKPLEYQFSAVLEHVAETHDHETRNETDEDRLAEVFARPEG